MIFQIRNYNYIFVIQFYDELHVLLGLSNYLELSLPDIGKHGVNYRKTALTRNTKGSLEC